MARGGEDHLGHVRLEPAARGDDAAGGVADDADIGIGCGADEAGGGGIGFLRQGGMGRGDDPVELCQEIIFIIQRAIGEDVDFAAGEDQDAGFFRAAWRRRGSS